MKLQRLDDRHYLPTLDGWRAVAIFIVIMSHDSLHHLGPTSMTWLKDNGRTGVNIFFALSGLLICTRLLREEALTGSIHLRKFYIRRFFRIQPAAWLYLVALSLLMLGGVLDHAFAGIAAAVLLVRNYVPVAFPQREWYTAHFWSLSVEEHFYLLLPGFLLLFRKRRARILLVAAGVLMFWLRLQWKFPALRFGPEPELRTENAIAGIVFACACAVLLQRLPIRTLCVRWLNPYGALALTFGVILLRDHANRLLGELLLLGVWPLLLMSTMLHPETWPSRLLESAPMRMIGTISYSLYLWQMLFFTHAGEIADPVSHSRVLSAIQHSGYLRYPAVLLCALASYYLVERPLVRIGHRIAPASRPPQHQDRRMNDTEALSVV